VTWLSHPLTTTALCLLLGAAVATQQRPPTAGVEVSDAAPLVDQIDPISVAAPSEPPLIAPSFASHRAAHEWLLEAIRSARFDHIEALFRPESGLSISRQLDLAGDLVQNYRRIDPRVVGRIVLRLPQERKSIVALNDLVTRWCQDDAEEALRFLETLPPERLNTILLHNASWGLSQLPADRLLMFAQRLNDQGRAYLAEGLATFAEQSGSWSNTSLALSRLDPKPEAKAIPFQQQLGGNLARTAPALIEQHLAAEPDARKRDAWLTGYSWVIGLADPAAALPLDARMSHPETREKHLRQHLTRWLKTDRTAALTWLMSDAARASLTPEQRQHWLQRYGMEAAP